MHDFANRHPAIFTFEILAACVCWISFLSWVTSLAAGWRSLAARYGTEREFPGRRRRMQSARMRSGVGINHALTVASDAEGLYLGQTIPILPGYPRLFIPWSEIQIEPPQRRLLLMMQRLRLGPDQIPLLVRQSLAEFLLQPRRSDPSSSGIASSSF